MADPQVENPQPEESQPEQPKKEENEVKEQPAQEEKEEQPAQEEKEQQPEEKQEEESKLEQKEEDQVDEDGQHRFHDRWTFWFDKKSANKKASDEDFVEALVKLGAFSTVEEFWSVYAHLAKPENLSKNCNIRLFRGDVVPIWENYAAGGFWILRFSHTNSINRIWEELVFSLIGERFEDDVVVGAVLSLRKQEDYISIWLKDNNPRFTIGDKLRQILSLDAKSHVEYKFIAHSLRDKSTCRNSKTYAL
eukprot:CAMPEP_0201483550 /NCGR_PEP_ID=MMETSP0151_2-20130828/7742_1 /ASSEMBLY_ACC=CAM_ASM_000257 /TAXON_ID=200890 /ORGANISM="Paramoeba atlantica, Strain 621/1 / CCAP 1560/9" /LENGTH=248 /DNA_ID=CAMNT_0047866733 /DNA_START=592 /DNA_END=1338 /DNA_ORIENTATION=+